jgi:hypothetical protein
MAQMYSEMQIPKGSFAQGNFTWEGEKSLPPGAKKVGREKLSGHMCNVYTYHDPKQGVKGKAWIASKLDFPIQAQGSSSQGEFFFRLKNIQPGGVSGSLMRPPANYRAMQIPPGMLQA